MKLIQLPEPSCKKSQSLPHNGEFLADLGLEQPNKFKEHLFIMRDKKKLFAHHYPAKSPILLF